MTPEQLKPIEVTPDQQLEGKLMAETCGLQDVAKRTIEVYGYVGTVEDGLGLCIPQIRERNMEPEQVRDWIMSKLKQQDSSNTPDHTV